MADVTRLDRFAAKLTSVRRLAWNDRWLLLQAGLLVPVLGLSLRVISFRRIYSVLRRLARFGHLCCRSLLTVHQLADAPLLGQQPLVCVSSRACERDEVLALSILQQTSDLERIGRARCFSHGAHARSPPFAYLSPG